MIMQKLRRVFHTNTLMFKLVAVMILNILIPILLIGSISFYSIYSILQNKIEKGVQTNLNEISQGLQTALDNLGYASRQLTLDGDIGKRLEQYLNPAVPNNLKSDIQSDIESRLNLISYANQGLGTMFYFIPAQHRTMFETMLLKKGANPMDMPLLGADPLTRYQGPHKSIYLYSDNTVLSIVQEMTGNPNIPKTYVYIETNYKLFKDLLAKNNFGFNVRYVILGKNRQVLYSELNDAYPPGAFISQDYVKTDTKSSSQADLRLFEVEGAGGWSIIAAASKKDLRGEITSWAVKYAAVAIFSLLLSLLLAWLIWRFIYRKMSQLKREIQLTGEYRFDAPVTQVNVVEFDDLIYRFHGMREKIVELLEEVEQKEKNKRMLEVQKLKYQINPHFIHNTLNTIQWIARINKQEEIVSLVSVFSRILHYNLGKEGEIVTVREEIEALKDYVTLQKIRYNHQFGVEFHVDEATLSLPIVRFLMQPIVENAMYHGFNDDDGTISIHVRLDSDDHFSLIVEDNGQGMDERTLQGMMNAEDGDRKRSGMGIGLRFVDQTIKQYFGVGYGLHIQSELGRGTRVMVRLPIIEHTREEEHP
ncbi:cache domain-containing sensor histidine kinase [Paenibacillus albus]|uniref:histidine kinase n=1 Tax=Paenibacillus albus TaxID=2495582 RepID=A0A3Q8X6E8_9BACL|nr:sensor histidine kinase [Paenibacillus albus]AZN40319.1 sensor histidine kinase [Paenibacillus albus]